MRAFVRNGVVMRIEQNYDADRIQDALGNSTTAHGTRADARRA
jgi:hypothetical protein